MARRTASTRADELLRKKKKTFEDEEEESDFNGRDRKEDVRRVVVAEDDISENNSPRADASAEEDDEGGDVDVENLEDGEEEDDDDSSDEGKFKEDYEPKTFLAHPYKPFDELAVEYFNGHKVSREAKNLVESGRDGFHAMSTKGKAKFPLGKFLEWLDDGVNAMVRRKVGGGTTRDYVGLVIIFGTLSFDELLATEYEAKYKDQLKEAMELVWDKIPESIPIITCFGSGVIVNVPKDDPQRGILQSSLELECDKLPFLSGLVVPKVEGLGIKRFVVTEDQCNRLKTGKISLKKCKEIMGITRENEKNLKGIAFFHSYVDKWTDNYNDSPAVYMLHTYLEANPHVAMAGGIHQTLLSNGTADEDVIACGILIFGEDNRVRVSCVALTEPEMSIGNKLKFNKFKTTLMARENENEEVSSFALMFGCNERGIRMHGRPHMESRYFHQMFPKTKLVGGFDLGEFYREILVHHPKNVTLPPPAQIHFIHVSVFLLVSYRHARD